MATFLSAALLMCAVAGVAGEGRMPVLVDFVSVPAPAGWRPVDDVVMGGVSRSRLGAGEDGAIFEGVLSLERGGGFASVRGPAVEADLSACSGVELRVRGDGKVYRLRLHDTDRLDGVAWQARFSTRAGEWVNPVLSLDAFEPSFRGRIVRGAPPLATGAIRQVGLMIADRQAGPFRLEVAWVRGYDCEG